MVAASAAKAASNGSAATPRVKKEYDLPGQTRETPAENDSLRLFYTSLLRQRPDSEMARRWCAQHGLLPKAEAERWVQEQAAKKGKAPAGGGAAAAKGKAAPAKGKTAATKGKAAPAKGKAGDKKTTPAKGKATPAKGKATPAKGKATPAKGAKKGAKRAAPIEDDWSDDSEAEVMPKPKRRASGPDTPFED